MIKCNSQKHKGRNKTRNKSHQARGTPWQGQVDVLAKEAHEGLLILFDTHLGSSTAANQQHLLLRALHLHQHFFLDLVEGLCASQLLGSLLLGEKT